MSLKSWLRNWLREDNGLCYPTNEPVRVRTGKLDDSGSLRFEVLKARGGFIIQTSRYDQKTDRSQNNLHLIRDDEDFTDAIGRIITMESMSL